jgi:hypothetical protein
MRAAAAYRAYMKTMLLAFVAALALMGCGKSDGASDRSLVSATIERYFQATARGDGQTVCRSLTEQARHGFGALLDVPPARDCEANVRKVARRSRPMRAVRVSQVVIGDDRATAYVTSARPPYSNSVVLVREGASWKLLYLPAAIHKFQFPRIAAPGHEEHSRAAG